MEGEFIIGAAKGAIIDAGIRTFHLPDRCGNVVQARSISNVQVRSIMGAKADRGGISPSREKLSFARGAASLRDDSSFSAGCSDGPSDGAKSEISGGVGGGFSGASIGTYTACSFSAEICVTLGWVAAHLLEQYRCLAAGGTLFM